MRRTEPTRIPEHVSRDRADLDALFASPVLAHIAFVDEDGSPAVVPTAVARLGDAVGAHGWAGVLRYGPSAATVHLAPDLRSGIPEPVSIGRVCGVR